MTSLKLVYAVLGGVAKMKPQIFHPAVKNCKAASSKEVETDTWVKDQKPKSYTPIPEPTSVRTLLEQPFWGEGIQAAGFPGCGGMSLALLFDRLLQIQSPMNPDPSTC